MVVKLLSRREGPNPEVGVARFAADGVRVRESFESPASGVTNIHSIVRKRRLLADPFNRLNRWVLVQSSIRICVASSKVVADGAPHPSHRSTQRYNGVTRRGDRVAFSARDLRSFSPNAGKLDYGWLNSGHAAGPGHVADVSSIDALLAVDVAHYSVALHRSVRASVSDLALRRVKQPLDS